MINFRKLKQDFSPTLLKEGKFLHEKKMVVSAKILNLSANNVRLSCRVQGSYDNHYQNEIEIDRHESTVLDSDCDCPHKYDCQHLAAALFFLEENFNEIVVNFSKENDIGKSKTIDKREKKKLQETIKEAEIKEVARKGKKYEKELLQEYVGSSQVLGQSPYFLPEEEIVQDQAELAVIFAVPQSNQASNFEIQLALRLPYRSKPLNVPNIKEFLDALRYYEPLYIGSKRYFFTLNSFDADSLQILKMVMDYARFPEPKNGEATPRIATLEAEAFGTILAQAYDLALAAATAQPVLLNNGDEQNLLSMPCLYVGSLEESLRFANSAATLRFELEYLEAPAPKIMLKPTIVNDGLNAIHFEETRLFECAKPGMIHQNIYYRFPANIKRKHLRHLSVIQNVTIPEPLFGTFVENSLPELLRFAEVTNRDIIDRFVTLPFVGQLRALCDINFLNGELDASLHFLYENIQIPAAPNQLTADHITSFVIPQGILARNLTEEQKIIDDLFQGFVFDQSQGVFVAKSDKKIVEFMTDVIPAHQDRVKFNCPENLLDQFVYDNTTFKLNLRETKRIDSYEVDLKVEGHLSGVTVNQLWECLSSKRAYIEIAKKRPDKKKGSANAAPATKVHKILVLDLEKLAPVIQIFDELGVGVLDDHREERPLWSLTSITPDQFEGLPIEFSMTERLQEIQQQMLGNVPMEPAQIPKVINAELRPYQNEGVQWLQRLRDMHLNGILADDMGLGKTLQAIIAITQSKLKHPKEISIVVCPTSLVYNWKEEIAKFNPKLKSLAVDGTPTQRKKLQTDLTNFDVIITSYTLLQKDIDFYKTIPFGYAILDEAQHIKNRMTRNAKSVKMIQAVHRLILTGTPLENSLEELWSLFDFLMPGLLSSYDRFVEKYIRNPSKSNGKNLEALRRKASPFILRRMKKEVLHDLPPISEIVYHCTLSEEQRELYNSYAMSAREELSQLVKKEGFDRIHIHVLATLTRLKQICCHPAIFAKEKAERWRRCFLLIFAGKR